MFIVYAYDFTYNRKSRGPKTNPCGTPIFIEISVESLSITIVYAVYWLYQFVHVYVFPTNRGPRYKHLNIQTIYSQNKAAQIYSLHSFTQLTLPDEHWVSCE